MGCFDLTPGVIALINDGKAAFSIDQQQRLQGYMPVIALHLYNTNAGMLPGGNINPGPGFVDKSNASAVAEQAGTNRSSARPTALICLCRMGAVRLDHPFFASGLLN